MSLRYVASVGIGEWHTHFDMAADSRSDVLRALRLARKLIRRHFREAT